MLSIREERRETVLVLACVRIDKMTVFGNPEAAARERMARLNPEYIRAFGGFRR